MRWRFDCPQRRLRADSSRFHSAGFSLHNKEFESTAKYSDWKFAYTPASQQVPAQQLQQPTAPSAR